MEDYSLHWADVWGTDFPAPAGGTSAPGAAGWPGTTPDCGGACMYTTCWPPATPSCFSGINLADKRKNRLVKVYVCWCYNDTKFKYITKTTHIAIWVSLNEIIKHTGPVTWACSPDDWFYTSYYTTKQHKIL